MRGNEKERLLPEMQDSCEKYNTFRKKSIPELDVNSFVSIKVVTNTFAGTKVCALCSSQYPYPEQASRRLYALSMLSYKSHPSEGLVRPAPCGSSVR